MGYSYHLSQRKKFEKKLFNSTSISRQEVTNIESDDYEDMIDSSSIQLGMKRIEPFLLQLSPKYRKIIQIYSIGLTFEEIGKEFGVTRGRIQQIYRIGIDKLQNSIPKNITIDFE